jgi:hypothetical protein
MFSFAYGNTFTFASESDGNIVDEKSMLSFILRWRRSSEHHKEKGEQNFVASALPPGQNLT